jgi:sensor histidine kinase YesM
MTAKENMTNKQYTQVEKARRGWWASVVFMLLIVTLIVFLSYVKIVEENRDILIGIIGMLTGSISSMLSIASGRDPSELEELKDKLSAANADRAALIARLRDAQIQNQLKTDQLNDIQTALVEKLPIWEGSRVVKHKTEADVVLSPHVEEWIPQVDREGNL